MSTLINLRSFTTLNKIKLRFIFKCCFVAFFLLWFSIYFIPAEDKPSLALLILLHPLFAFLTAAMIFVFIFLNSFLSYSAQRKMFNKNSFKLFFDKYNFEMEAVGAHNRWMLTNEMMVGKIESFPIAISRNPAETDSAAVLIETTGEKATGDAGENVVAKFINSNSNIEEQLLEIINWLSQHGIQPGRGERYT